MKMCIKLGMLLGAIGILSIGCADSYHRYGDGCVPCRYCPLPPLPWRKYRECQCHADVASPYLAPQMELAGETPLEKRDPTDDQAN